MLDSKKKLNLGSSLIQQPCYKVAIENYSNNDVTLNTNECYNHCDGLSSYSTYKICHTQGVVLCIKSKSVDNNYDFIIDCNSSLIKYHWNGTTFDIDNSSNVAMNTVESRGRITDADFALESANLTRAQILQQSATAMIAQASKSMQTVLDLLR